MQCGPYPLKQNGVKLVIHNPASTEVLPSGSINRAFKLFAATTSGVGIIGSSSITKGNKEQTGSSSITKRNNQLNLTKEEHNANAKRRHKESKNNQKQRKTSQVRNDKDAAVVETTDNSAPDEDAPDVPVVDPPQAAVEQPYDYGTYQDTHIYVRCRLKTFQESWFMTYGGWRMLIHDTVFILPIMSIILWFLMEFTDYAWCWQIYFAVYWFFHMHFNFAMACVLVSTTFVYPFLVHCGVPHFNLLTIIVLYIFHNKVDPYVVPPGFLPISSLPGDTMSVHLALEHTHYKQVRISDLILEYLLNELGNLNDRKTIINTALHKVNKIFRKHSIEDRTNTVYYFKNLLTFKQVTDDSFVSSGGNIGAS